MAIERHNIQPIRTRFLSLEDVPLVQEVERLCFNSNKGGVKDLANWLSTGTNAGVVAVQGDKVLGFVLYTIHLQKKQVNIYQLAVRPTHRRKGIGRSLLQRVLSGIPKQDTDIHVLTCVNERNVTFQLFLHANAFKCVDQRRGVYDGEHDKEDLYLFHFAPQSLLDHTATPT